jgi:hypothetical protein
MGRKERAQKTATSRYRRDLEEALSVDKRVEDKTAAPQTT